MVIGCGTLLHNDTLYLYRVYLSDISFAVTSVFLKLCMVAVLTGN